MQSLVVDPAGDDRLIGVAFQEIDDDLLADTRDHDAAPALPGPDLGHPYPAGAGLVRLAVAVPVELDLDPTVLVRPDLLARLADDDGGLGTLDDWFSGEARRPVGDSWRRWRSGCTERPVLRAARRWTRTRRIEANSSRRRSDTRGSGPPAGIRSG